MKKETLRGTIITLLILAGNLLLVSPSPGQDTLTDAMVSERIGMIEHMLDQQKVRADRWWYGWLAGYGAATIVQTTICLTSDELGTRQDMALGAATTLLGAAGQIISPLKPDKALQVAEQLPEQTRAEKMNRLAEDERLLQQKATLEKSGKSWQTHAICTAVNLGSGLVTWIGFNRNVWAGLGNFALNTVITEAQIFSQPGRSRKEFDRYRKKYMAGDGTACTGTDINWSLNVYAGRVSLVVNF
jgi:hypothetical protein